MVAGVIAVAAADELVVAHPGDPGRPASVAILALAVRAPVGAVVPALALAAAAGLVLLGLPAWVARASQRRPRVWRQRPEVPGAR
jgi:hypothetical protein